MIHEEMGIDALEAQDMQSAMQGRDFHIYECLDVVVHIIAKLTISSVKNTYF
jgi:hypothetical protein